MSNIELNPEEFTIDGEKSYTEWLTEMANVIREKTDTTEPIKPVAFPTKMKDISSGALLKIYNNVNSVQFELTGIPANFVHNYANIFNTTSLLMSSANNPSTRCYLTGDAKYISGAAFGSSVTVSSKIQLITDISFKKCETIGTSAFRNLSSNISKTASFPECTMISNDAFMFANISAIYAPKCKTIGTQAFYNVTDGTTGLTDVTLGSPESIGYHAFYYQQKMTDGINFKNTKYIGSAAFAGCNNFAVPLDAPKCSRIEGYSQRPLFGANYGVSYIYLPSLRSVAISTTESRYNLYATFTGMYGLEFAYISYRDTLSSNSYNGSYAFSSCYNLKNVVLINFEGIGNRMFSGTSNLTSIFLWHSDSTKYTTVYVMSSASDYPGWITSRVKIVVPDYAYDLQYSYMYSGYRSMIMSLPEDEFKARVKELVDEYRGVDTSIW